MYTSQNTMSVLTITNYAGNPWKTGCLHRSSTATHLLHSVALLKSRIQRALTVWASYDLKKNRIYCLFQISFVRSEAVLNQKQHFSACMVITAISVKRLPQREREARITRKTSDPLISHLHKWEADRFSREAILEHLGQFRAVLFVCQFARPVWDRSGYRVVK